MKNMSQKILICVILSGISILSFSQQVVATSGNTLQKSTGSISFTLGEPVTGTFAKENTTLTQGFHQPTLTIVSTDEYLNENISCRVYPNPTSDLVHLEMKNEEVENMVYILYGAEGKELMKKNIESSITEISFDGLNPAIYILIVEKDGKDLETYKIIKQ
jgi:hypothetical protein